MVNMRTEEELKDILDDFIQYKDYFENPPEDAYLADDMDYSECREAIELMKLLYKHEVYDTKYYPKLEMMEKKYGTIQMNQLSREKLSLEEVFAVFTWIHREERHCGVCFLRAIENKTFYNLLCRMEEIRNEMETS